MYCQFLSNSFPAPGTMKNHLPGVKAWLAWHGGIISNFSALEVSLMTKSICEKSNHVQSPAPALTSDDIRIICDYIYIHSIRQLNLLFYLHLLLLWECQMCSGPTFHHIWWQTYIGGPGHPHNRCGVEVYDSINQDKERETTPQPWIVFPAADASLCPVLAWMQYYRVILPCPLGPAFMTNYAVPLTAPPVVTVMSTDLPKAGSSHRSSQVARALAKNNWCEGKDTDWLSQF